MPEKKGPNLLDKEPRGDSADESERHAQWVREHPRMDDSAFPEYPDEPARRGSSRGAVPNGNPWRPVDPDEKPGRADDTSPASLRADAEPAAPAPPAVSPHEPTLLDATNETDERIGIDIAMCWRLR